MDLFGRKRRERERAEAEAARRRLADARRSRTSAVTRGHDGDDDVVPLTTAVGTYGYLGADADDASDYEARHDAIDDVQNSSVVWNDTSSSSSSDSGYSSPSYDSGSYSSSSYDSGGSSYSSSSDSGGYSGGGDSGGSW